MKIKLILWKRKGLAVYEGVHEITDAENFGRAFGDAYAQLQDRRLQKATSIGALMESLNDDVLEELDGVKIGLEKV